MLYGAVIGIVVLFLPVRFKESCSGILHTDLYNCPRIPEVTHCIGRDRFRDENLSLAINSVDKLLWDLICHILPATSGKNFLLPGLRMHPDIAEMLININQPIRGNFRAVGIQYRFCCRISQQVGFLASPSGRRVRGLIPGF